MQSDLGSDLSLSPVNVFILQCLAIGVKRKRRLSFGGFLR